MALYTKYLPFFFAISTYIMNLLNFNCNLISVNLNFEFFWGAKWCDSNHFAKVSAFLFKIYKKLCKIHVWNIVIIYIIIHSRCSDRQIPDFVRFYLLHNLSLTCTAIIRQRNGLCSLSKLSNQSSYCHNIYLNMSNFYFLP